MRSDSGEVKDFALRGGLGLPDLLQLRGLVDLCFFMAAAAAATRASLASIQIHCSLFKTSFLLRIG